MKLSVIMAFRDSSPEQYRKRLFDFMMEQYARHLPEAEVSVGQDDGLEPFHKTLALNRAVASASGDLFLLADADTWCPAAQIREAVYGIEAQPGTWWRPWNQKLKLGEADTESVLKRETWNEEPPQEANSPYRRESLDTYWAAPPHLFARDQYHLVRGFDERFRGWGGEDEAFALSLRAMVGRPKAVLGFAYHLHHPRIGKSGKDQWVGELNPRANEALATEYRRLVRYPDRMEKLVDFSVTAPFISTDDLGFYVGQDLSASDLAIMMTDAACEFIRAELNQFLNLVVDDEITLDGRGRDMLILPEHPIVEVTEVIVDADDPLVVDDDYRVVNERTMLQRLSSGSPDDEVVWSLDTAVHITYTHGYAVIEPDVDAANGIDRVPSSIRAVALDLAAAGLVAGRTGVGGVSSETLGRYKYSIDTTNSGATGMVLEDEQYDILRKYCVEGVA